MKNGTADGYIIWSLDSNGNYITNTSAASGSSSGIVSLETSFQQDLNDDGVIGGGVSTSTIESYGSTSLVQVGSNFYFYPVGGSSGPQFKYNGPPVSVGQYASLTYIAAEQTASGYAVAIKIQGADQYTVWNTDSNGTVVSNGTGGVYVSGASSVLKSHESSFQQDLNGDGVIGGGVSTSTVESYGSTSLRRSGVTFTFTRSVAAAGRSSSTTARRCP